VTTPRALAIDLGSTAIKAGRLDREGRLYGIESVPAPPLRVSGKRVEGDAREYMDAARGLLARLVAGVPAGVPLGLACQRSSFALWERQGGAIRSPLISWQDTRAARWCASQAPLAELLRRQTGLVLSAHYLGPKLAALRAEVPAIGEALADGTIVCGTLDTLLLWRSTGGGAFEIDRTMAARTALLDITSGAWSVELLDACGVAARALPTVVPSLGRNVELDLGPIVTASLADQASGALVVCGASAETTLISLGTGAFVLRPVEQPRAAPKGLLLAPILDAGVAGCRFAFEGSINGAGPALDACAPAPTALPEIDPSPTAFALPDRAGLGAPHWRPEIGLTLSPAAALLDPSSRRRVVLEGLLFRIAEILELMGTPAGSRIVLAGGVTRDPALAQGLATLRGEGVEVVDEPEAVLLGAARLAAGMSAEADLPTVGVESGPRGAYLGDKYRRWRAWLTAGLERGFESH
jgi:glycerol kinase